MPHAASSTALPAGRQAPSPLTYRVAMLLLLGVFLASLATFAARPAEGASFAVIVPPSAGQAGLMRAVGDADGVLVRQSRYPWLAVAAPRDERSAADFRAALKAGGALLLLHPALLAGCFDRTLSDANARQNA